MLKRLLLMLAVMALLIGCLAYFKVNQIKGFMAMGKKMAPPPPAVTTVVVKAQKWQPTLPAVGSLKAVNGVLVSTDLAGIVSEISFESGMPVKKGELLLKLDTKQERAQLTSAQAKLDLAKLTLARQKELFGKKASSKAEFDSAVAEERQAEAQVEEVKALIARKTIQAPFDGIIGIRQVNVGQYLNVGAPIAPLQSLDPIYVEFNIPQQSMDQIAKGKSLQVKAEGGAGETFAGEITAIDSRMDESTRNVLIEGTIRNPQQKLRPGMYSSVEVLLPEQQGVLALPASSINYAPYGDSVFVVSDGKDEEGKPAKVVKQQFVKIGPSRGDLVAILSGVKEGDEVVSSGVFRLRSDSPVIVNNMVQPASETNPHPPET
jgi:membrane fusion protein (multidrug efflux system)